MGTKNTHTSLHVLHLVVRAVSLINLYHSLGRFSRQQIDDFPLKNKLPYFMRGWSDGAKVSCILCHWVVQLILAYSWARPAILVVGKGRGGMFLFLLFLPFHSCSSFFPAPLFHLFYYLFCLFSPFLWEKTQNDP